MLVLFTILSLFLGLAYGLSGLELGLIDCVSNHSDLVLYLLMFTIGISIGMHDGIIGKIRGYGLKILMIPLGTTIGSVAGGFLCAWILGLPLFPGAAIASGMGWYSLAGATITNLGGAELGSIAFLSNLMREIFAFLLIPVLAVRCNSAACISAAGATSEDTTLPVLLKYTNEETVVISVLHGIICSFFVPILISFFFQLA